jgi:hypothetical protein
MILGNSFIGCTLIGMRRASTTGNTIVRTTSGEVVEQTSARACKTCIRNYNKGLEFLANIQPKIYNAIDDPGGQDLIGFIADDFDDEDLKEFVNYDLNGEVSGLQYDKLTTILLNSIKELEARVIELENK